MACVSQPVTESKIAPMGWMRETVVSDDFQLLVLDPRRTQLLALPKVGRDGGGST